jgi:beta-lactam-binding protein with PASTA domain
MVRDVVRVPDVVGMPFHIARDLAREAGVTLANPDPDGPPIASLAWPGLFYVTSQSPAPGAECLRWDSVCIEVEPLLGASNGQKTTFARRRGAIFGLSM